VKAWIQQLAELRNILAFLRPYLVRQPLLLTAVLVSALFVMLFEGFGVGLLVPLLNLLLGGERATPMRPIQWLERALPDHSPAFYIGAIAVAIVLAVALKNAAFYTSLVLAARLKRRIAVGLRATSSAAPPADLDLFDRLQERISPTSFLSRPAGRRSPSIRCSRSSSGRASLSSTSPRCSFSPGRSRPSSSCSRSRSGARCRSSTGG
jgi:hypothetical protein